MTCACGVLHLLFPSAIYVRPGGWYWIGVVCAEWSSIIRLPPARVLLHWQYRQYAVSGHRGWPSVFAPIFSSPGHYQQHVTRGKRNNAHCSQPSVHGFRQYSDQSDHSTSHFPAWSPLELLEFISHCPACVLLFPSLFEWDCTTALPKWWHSCKSWNPIPTLAALKANEYIVLFIEAAFTQISIKKFFATHRKEISCAVFKNSRKVRSYIQVS